MSGPLEWHSDEALERWFEDQLGPEPDEEPEPDADLDGWRWPSDAEVERACEALS